MPARHGADRHTGLERLRDKAGLVLKPPPPAPLRPTQNLDPHRPDLMTLMLALRSDLPLRVAPPQGGPGRARTRNLTHGDLLRVSLAILLPPLGVFLTVGHSGQFWLQDPGLRRRRRTCRVDHGPPIMTGPRAKRRQAMPRYYFHVSVEGTV